MGIIENFTAMLERGQDNALLRYSLGNEYFKTGEWESAIAHLQQALAQDPDYSAAWKVYGKALLQAQRYADAQAAFERGIAVAEQKGDVQAAKEMRVFLKRTQSHLER